VRKFWPLSRQKNTGIILGFLVIVIASLALLLANLPPVATPSTAEIWQALESGDYQAAINKAQICIKLYAATARENQSTLAKMHEPYPP
jgi:hypothetical protein